MSVKIFQSQQRRQRGAILPLVAIGALAIIGVAGLAIDSSHAFVNVTRVQNALDAAALSAAKTLQLTNRNTALATADGTATFAAHLEGELANSGVTVAFQYSTSLNPWTPSNVNPDFVRATANNHTIGMFFARVLPGVGDTWTIGSTAVAGPVPLRGGEVCDIAPLMVCGDVNDTDPTDGTIGGLPVGTGALTCLKYGGGTNTTNNNSNNGGGPGTASPCDAQFPDDDGGVGPGNYHLLRLGGSGGNIVRENLAGGFRGCASIGGSVDTEPGVTAGPVGQGLNTRFGIYQGGMSESAYPPDLVVTSPQTYAEYSTAYAGSGPFAPNGQENRRVVAVPIVNCDGIQNGQSTVPVIDFGCYFFRKAVDSGGQNNYIEGELIDNCETDGFPGDTVPSTGGPLKIILFNDPGNPAT